MHTSDMLPLYRRFLLCWVLCSILALFVQPCRANTNVRNWKLKTGECFSAELVSFDKTTGIVHLRIDETKDREFASSTLSLPDQAWLGEWKDLDDEMEVKRQQLGGKISYFHSSGPMSAGFYVYRPSKAALDAKLPLFILFEPSGQASRFLMRFMETAEAVQCTVVCCDSFHNTKDDPKMEALMLERFRLLLPLIEAIVPHDPDQLFMGGASGGAWRAYHYSAQFHRPWAGIFANGGWLGGQKYYQLPYPDKLRVAMVNGNRDEAASQWVEPDSKVLAQRGATVAVMSFEGGHQVPPVSVQIKAFQWLLGRNEQYRVPLMKGF